MSRHRLHRLEREIEIARPPEEVSRFFAAPENLADITPPWLRFQIVTPGPLELREGVTIDYRLRVRGIPLRWTSAITVWEPPARFVDEQVRGPYRRWVHEHTFVATDAGTRVGDLVHYAVPGGALVNRLFVRGDLERIFDHRYRRLVELLG